VAVRIIHVYKDFLWAAGPRASLPNSPEEKEEKAEEEENSQPPETIEAAAAAPPATVSEPKLPEGDELIQLCLARALKTRVTTDALPMLASTFYAAHMLPARPPGTTVDLKHSSFKKLSKVLEWAKAEDMLDFETDESGTITITMVNRENPRVRAADRGRQFDEPEEEDAAAASKEEQPLVTEMYAIPSKAHTIFGLATEAEAQDAVVNKSQATAALVKYVKQKGLDAASRRKDCVVLDEALAAVLGTKVARAGLVEKRELVAAFIAKLHPFYIINREDIPERERLRKGMVPLIRIAVVKRAGNKKMTKINGLEAFCVKPTEVAEDLSKIAAASATTQPSPRGPPGALSVLVQGDCTRQAVELLTTKYRIPGKFIVAAAAGV
jgi:translation initiation factor 2D